MRVAELICGPTIQPFNVYAMRRNRKRVLSRAAAVVQLTLSDYDLEAIVRGF